MNFKWNIVMSQKNLDYFPDMNFQVENFNILTDDKYMFAKNQIDHMKMDQLRYNSHCKIKKKIHFD